MKKVLIKKAFTLVELLVVIAILAVLATVSIIGYSSFTKKAQISNDESVIAQMNTALQADEAGGKPQTPSEVIDLLQNVGFVVQNLTPAANGYEYIYNMETNRFAYVDDNGEVVSGKLADDAWNNWQFIDKFPTNDRGYSYYLKEGFAVQPIEVSAGIDLGKNKGFESVTISAGSVGKDIVVRTIGDDCTLTVNAPLDDIDFYGYAKDVNVLAVKNASMHIYGVAAGLSVTSGHVEVEDTGVIFTLKKVDGGSASVTNNGYIAAKAATVTAEVEGNEVGGMFNIKTRAQFESFRDAVNGGYDFYGLTVNLLADITLKDGWNPIGEGARKAGGPRTIESAWVYNGTGYAFKGTFNGNGHTISNLNNKGFEPSQKRLSQDENNTIYSYGLFGITASGACIKNLNLSGVDIDTTIYTGSKGDCVGAVVGFSCGTLEIENVTVNGKIYGNEAVAGLVGRAYSQDKDLVEAHMFNAQVIIKNCSVNAEIKTTGSHHAAGILGYTSKSTLDGDAYYLVFTIEGCTVSGSITSVDGGAKSAAGIICMGSNCDNFVMKDNKVENCVISGKLFAGIFAIGFSDATNTTVKGIVLDNCTFSNVTMKVNGAEVQPLEADSYIH